MTGEPRWEGPFKGYIKGTPKNTDGKSKTVFCKTLEEAKEFAKSFDGLIGGITKINDTKFSLRLGNRVLESPKKEESWLLVNPKSVPITSSYPNIPENEEDWTEEDHKLYDKWEEEEDKKWFITKQPMKEDKNQFNEWIYNERVFLLNPITNEVLDKNTKNKIGNRIVFKSKKERTIFEVLVWSVTPYI